MTNRYSPVLLKHTRVDMYTLERMAHRGLEDQAEMSCANSSGQNDFHRPDHEYVV